MEIKIQSKRREKTIEYRFVPRKILDTQFNQVNLESSLGDMFGNIIG
tara:strand:+ start:5912 stop:6052 length:141 start_codon:yes stop_codon:yes gene_type:complete